MVSLAMEPLEHARHVSINYNLSLYTAYNAGLHDFSSAIGLHSSSECHSLLC